MNELIRVGMADYKICRTPSKISTLGLGSCLGVVLYDKANDVCGLAHVMLPDSKRIANDENRCKFADTCIEDMFNDLIKNGAEEKNIKAKIAGGSRMFENRKKENAFMNVGAQNVLAVHRILAKKKIRVVAEDVGLNYSRSITFDLATEQLLIKAVGVGEFVI